MSTPQQPLMPKATAVWLVDNTSLSFEQIAEFCGLHLLEVKGIADGDVAQGVRGKNPITAGELGRDEISRAEKDSDYRLKLLKSKVKIPEIKTKKRPRYTPVSRRQDRPNAVLWLLRNHGELKDSQIMRLVGTTKPTINQIRDRTHWNSQNLQPQDPVTLGLCSQLDLDGEVDKAIKRVEKERKAAGLPPLEKSETLVPTAETTGYEAPGAARPEPDAAPTAENVFGQASSSPQADEAAETARSEADEAARVFAKLQDMKTPETVPETEAETPADLITGPPDETPAEARSGSTAPDGGDMDAALEDESAAPEDAAPATPPEAPAASATPTNEEHLEAVGRYVPDFNEAAARGIIRHLGIALRSRDASLVACSSKDELARVRESWCKKKLALSETDEEIDQMIAETCEKMAGDRQKNRVAFYYMLADRTGKLAELE